MIYGHWYKFCKLLNFSFEVIYIYYCHIKAHVCDCLLFQVLKIAVLAEKYAIDYTWYVDVILNLIRLTGDYVSEEVN
jgi:hypothetical protein